jgi:hypothetical protein
MFHSHSQTTLTPLAGRASPTSCTIGKVRAAAVAWSNVEARANGAFELLTVLLCVCLCTALVSEVLESDPALGMNLVLLVGVVGSWTAALLVMLGWDRSEKKPTETAESRAARLSFATSASRAQAARLPSTSSWHANDVHDL